MAFTRMAQCSGLAQVLCARCERRPVSWLSMVGRQSRRLPGGLRSGIQNNSPRIMDVVVGGTSCMNRVPSNYGTLKSADGALLGIGETNAPRTHVESLLQAGCILCHMKLAGSAGCLGIRWPSASIQPKVKSSAGSATRKPYRANAKQRLGRFWAAISPAISSLQGSIPRTSHGKHAKIRLAQTRLISMSYVVAEWKGFEPSRRFPACTLSRGVPSTTRPPLRRPV